MGLKNYTFRALALPSTPRTPREAESYNTNKGLIAKGLSKRNNPLIFLGVLGGYFLPIFARSIQKDSILKKTIVVWGI